MPRCDGPFTRITATGPEVISRAATGLPDLDTRGTVAPTAAQRDAIPPGT
jgi:hypothetical protein